MPATTDRPLLSSIRSAIARHGIAPLGTRDAINIIQSAYRRLVGGGRDLDWETAARLWDLVRAIDDEAPSEAWMIAVSCYLVAEDYDAVAIRRIVSHIAATGTAEGCPELDEGRDSEAVSELLKGRGR